MEQAAPFQCARPTATNAKSTLRSAFPASDALNFSALMAFPFFFPGLGNLREEQDALQRALGKQDPNRSVEDLPSLC
jgi:hypothetical protein